MFLEKKISFNNGIHKSYFLYRPIPINNKTSLFNILKKKNRNKNLFNKNILRSIKPYKKKIIFKKILISYNLKLLKFLTQFVFSSFNKKILSLFCCSNGLFFISYGTSIHYLFKFYSNTLRLKRRKYRLKRDIICLWKLKRLNNFCAFSFFFSDKKKYARAVGSRACLTRIDKDRKIGVIQMPSKKKKIISLYNFAFKGRIKCFSNKKLKITKAGYLRLRGKKANSRGVAMNPIDHPHGGNTNSLKLQRTPWGTPTKKK